VGRDLIEASPVTRVPKIDAERERERALDDDEIRRFWRGCDEIGWPFGPLLQLLLVTAQRRDEVGGMEWSEIDRDKRLWIIPRERAKSDRAIEAHLSSLAIEILASLTRIGAEPRFVFTTNEKRPVSGFSKAKARLDAKTGIKDWVFHDLRRSATTAMARLGVAPHVADRILNHTGGSIRGVARVYNRYAYFDERKAALDLWGRYLEGLIRPVPPNVVPLRCGELRRSQTHIDRRG